MFLSHFEVIRPPFETDQKSALDWMVAAHTQSERLKVRSEEDLSSFQKTLEERLWHVGCKPNQISKRGHVLKDFLHRDWESMEIYRLSSLLEGESLSVRSACFEKAVDAIFEEYYPIESSPPSDLVHVSCTGYVSPSSAQKIVSKRGWGRLTTVTHAYHMGCYGSIPAIRMGIGFLHSGKSKVDIVHTEICSLHSNPSLHETDQLVSQSLFADGFIKYSLLPSSKNPHFKVLAVQEEILENSTHAMTWNVAHWGFQMSLSKEVPVHITRELLSFLERLTSLAKIPLECLLKKALFAIHPGGPKILLYIQKLLNLSDLQIEKSFEVLKNYGNMSSATLPHIWDQILRDDQIPENTLVASLAFGPGLSISGNLLEKRCG